MFKEARWLTYSRVAVWSGALIAEQSALLAFVALAQHGFWGKALAFVSSDFVSFYAAGHVALFGGPHLAYDPVVHFAAERLELSANNPYIFFFYPPPFLIVCILLASIPFWWSYLIFEVSSLCLYIAAVKQVLKPRGWLWLLPTLAFPSVFWNIGLGQNAFLTAAIFGFGTALLDRRPNLAGGVLGLLVYKPHFAILIPVALMARRKWQAVFSFTISFFGLAAISLLLFGSRTWDAYIRTLGDAADVYQSGKIMFAGFASVFGSARLLGVDLAAAYSLQAGTLVLAAACTFWLWASPRSTPPILNASLLACTLLAIPLALIYDLMILAVSICWLYVEARDSGFFPWERLLLAVLYVSPFFFFWIGLAVHVPLAPIAPVIVVGLCIMHALRRDKQNSSNESVRPSLSFSQPR